jgi:hypothetical protein
MTTIPIDHPIDVGCKHGDSYQRAQKTDDVLVLSRNLHVPVFLLSQGNPIPLAHLRECLKCIVPS